MKCLKGLTDMCNRGANRLVCGCVARAAKSIRMLVKNGPSSCQLDCVSWASIKEGIVHDLGDGVRVTDAPR